MTNLSIMKTIKRALKAVSVLLVGGMMLMGFGSFGQGAADNGRSDAGFDFYTHMDKAMNVPFGSVTSEAGFTYVTGTRADYAAAAGSYIVVCINSDGTLVWEKQLPVSAAYSSEYGLAITLDEDDNPVVSGVKWNGHDADMLTLKLNATTGETIWESLYAGALQYMDVPYRMATDAQGNIFITGITYTGTNTSWLTLKYNAAGALQWSRVLENNLADSYIEPKDLHVDAMGNVGITGYHGNSAFYQCYFTVVYNGQGDEVWSDLLEEEGSTQINSVARGITADDEGNWYVTGILNVDDPHMLTLKYDATGNVVWQQTAAGEWSQGLFIEKGAGAVYAAGRHFGDWTDDGTLLISYGFDGSEKWVRATNDLIDVRTGLLTLDNALNPIVSGWGSDATTFDQRLAAVKYDADGNVLNDWAYNIPSTGFGNFIEFQGLSADAEGDLYLTFNSFYTDLGGVFEVSKVEMGNGASEGYLWNYRYSEGMASAIELLSTFNDQQNNTYFSAMADTIIGTDYYQVYVIGKYNSTGTVVWDHEFSALNGNEANGIQMRVTPQGDVYVYLGATFEGPVRIKKYTTDGMLAWEKEEMPGSAIYEVFTTDKDGNFILAGSGEEQGAGKFLVRKIAADGQDLWTAYSSREGFSDDLHSIGEITTDGAGNIYLTGKAGTGGWISQETDIAVLKYSAAGALSWLSYFAEENKNTVGTSVYVNDAGSIFVNGYSEDRSSGEQQMLVMRLNDEGGLVWKQHYAENGRRVSSYNTRQLSNGDLIVSGFSVIDGLNNKVIMVKYDDEGNFKDVYETEFFRFYRDVHLDAADNYYLYAQMTSSPYPMKPYYSAGAMPLGALIKLTPSGNLTEELYYGPELSDFYPCMLLPLPDGRLLMSGKVSNEMSQFGGLYFFASEHIPVGLDDPELPQRDLTGAVYPNPANETAILPITLQRGANVALEISDISGKLVRVVYSGYLPEGLTNVAMDLSLLEKGVYLYTLRCGEKLQSGKVVVK